jgi:hypothetical protein
MISLEMNCPKTFQVIFVISCVTQYLVDNYGLYTFELQVQTVLLHFRMAQASNAQINILAS